VLKYRAFSHLNIFVFQENLCICNVTLGAGTQVLAGTAGWPCEGRRGRGCPGPDTAGSSRPRLTPRRARLSPAAMVGRPQGKRSEERDKNAVQ